MARGLLAAALVACAAVAQEVQMEARASVRCPTLSITKLEMRAPPAARGPRQPAQGLCPAALVLPQDARRSAAHTTKNHFRRKNLKLPEAARAAAKLPRAATPPRRPHTHK